MIFPSLAPFHILWTYIRTRQLDNIQAQFDILFASDLVDIGLAVAAKSQMNDIDDRISTDILVQVLAILLSPALWIQEFARGAKIPQLVLPGVSDDLKEDLVPIFGGAYLNTNQIAVLFAKKESLSDSYDNLVTILFFLLYTFAFVDVDGPQEGVESEGLHYHQFAHLLHPKAMEKAREFGN